MKRIMMVLLVVMLVGVAGTAMAATASLGFTVSATAAKSCSISTATDVVFATAYDPTSATDNDSGQGAATFRCTKNTTWDAYITGARSMTGTTFGDTLTFELFSDATRLAVFPNATPSAVTGTSGSKNTDIVVDYFGRITAGQDVSAPDTYSTAIGGMVFTINY